MPSRLTCRLGRVGSASTELPLPLALDGRPIEDYLADASRRDGEPVIELAIDDRSLTGTSAEPSGAVTARELHRALDRLVANPSPARRVERVGVLFASRYRPMPAAFGVMFDRGVITWDDRNPAYTRVPREGCAVFVDAIADRRSATELDDEIAFTALHEIGHLFNLWHVDAPPGFLSRSARHRTALTTREFAPEHRELLRLADRSAHVWPGGSRYGDLGTLRPAPDADAWSRRLEGGGVALRIDVEQPRFHPWEPIELELELRLPRRARRSMRVPHRVDPGYPELEIWIESPAGERRRYASPNRYCAPRSWLTIAPRAPFRRDISLFRDADGPIFRTAGRHRIEARFDLGARGHVRSNRVEVEVLADPHHGSRAARMRELLDRADVARLLYYREAEPRSAAVSVLRTLCDEDPHEPAAAGALYALGRMYLTVADMRRGRGAQWLRDRARDDLRHAVAHPHLTRHRREIAEKLLRSLGD